MLFVSDLDGTLLDRRGQLSTRTRAGLVSLLEGGLSFTVATARSLVSMRGVLGELPLSLPVVGFNGGYVSDLASGRHLRVCAVPDPAARAVVARAAHLGLPTLVSTWSETEDRLFVPRVHNDGVALYLEERRRAGDPRVRVVDDPSAELAATVTCLTVIGRRPAMERLTGQLLPHGDALELHLFDDPYTVGWTWLTAHPGQATKGSAIQEIRADHDLLGGPLVVFGDGLNDLSMFAVADHAVAPANAEPAVRDAADEVIGHHHDDAVITWLLENT